MGPPVMLASGAATPADLDDGAVADGQVSDADQHAAAAAAVPADGVNLAAHDLMSAAAEVAGGDGGDYAVHDSIQKKWYCLWCLTSRAAEPPRGWRRKLKSRGRNGWQGGLQHGHWGTGQQGCLTAAALMWRQLRAADWTEQAPGPPQQSL